MVSSALGTSFGWCALFHSLDVTQIESRDLPDFSCHRLIPFPTSGYRGRRKRTGAGKSACPQLDRDAARQGGRIDEMVY